jgi:hypothetical protein
MREECRRAFDLSTLRHGIHDLRLAIDDLQWYEPESSIENPATFFMLFDFEGFGVDAYAAG